MTLFFDWVSQSSRQNHFPLSLQVRPIHSKWNHSIKHESLSHATILLSSSSPHQQYEVGCTGRLATTLCSFPPVNRQGNMTCTKNLSNTCLTASSKNCESVKMCSWWKPSHSTSHHKQPIVPAPGNSSRALEIGVLHYLCTKEKPGSVMLCGWRCLYLNVHFISNTPVPQH